MKLFPVIGIDTSNEIVEQYLLERSMGLDD